MKHIKKNKYYLLGFVVLFLVIAANAFPRGYVFSGGDTSQFIEAKNNLRLLFYDWQGRAVLYYGIFYILDCLGINETAQLSWYLGIFVFGSYISSGIFSKLVFRTSDRNRFFISLFYALNLYTLYIFSGNLGFSYFFSLYVFIPVLAGFFIKFLLEQKNIYGALFVVATFLGSSGFGNAAFALSFSFFLFLILAFFIVAKSVVLDRKLGLKIALIAILSFFINAFWLLPEISEMKSGVERLAASNVIEFSYIIRHASSPLLNTLSMINASGDHFPDNFPYKNFYFLKQAFFVLAFLPFAVILWGFINLKKFDARNKKIFLAFGGILIVMSMLAARITDPFEIVNKYIYSVWGMQTLRGFDKTAIYFPFIFSVLLLVILDRFGSKKWILPVMAIILLVPLPFYTGKIQQNLSYRFSNASPENKDFRKSKLSFLVKIPDEYYEIRDLINADSEKAFIATLPYTSNDGSGISNFPKWKMYGTDITQYLYNKKIIPANASSFPDWNYTRDFSEQEIKGDHWLTGLLGAMNVKYIIFHKDSPEDSVNATEYRMEELEKDGLITNLDDNAYFSLYKIKDDLVLPYVSWQSDSLPITPNGRKINEELEKIRENSNPARFREINPKKIEISIDDKKTNKILVLAENYDSNWRAYLVTKDKKEIEIRNHFLERGYANGWLIPDEYGDNIDHVLVEYYPARLMQAGIFIGFPTALFLFVYLIIYYYGHEKYNRKNIA